MLSKEEVTVIYGNVKTRFPSLPEKLKPQQIEVLVSIINGRHTFGILPTGFGKSLIYSVFALILDTVK